MQSGEIPDPVSLIFIYCIASVHNYSSGSSAVIQLYRNGSQENADIVLFSLILQNMRTSRSQQAVVKLAPTEDNCRDKNYLQQQEQNESQLLRSPQQIPSLPYSSESIESPSREQRLIRMEKLPQNPTLLGRHQRKRKLIKYKCRACNATGMKKYMIICPSCKNKFHQICVETDNPLTFVCEFCVKEDKNNHSEINHLVSSDKKEIWRLRDEELRDQDNKFRNNKVDTVKLKRALWSEGGNYKSQLAQFHRRHPQYFRKNTLLYPVDDKLFLVYPDLFRDTRRDRMQLRTHPLIPTSLVAEFLDIENFFLSFEPWLRENYTLPLGLQKDQLYASLDYNGCDSAFLMLYGCLLRLYLSEIFQGVHKDSIKKVNDDSFLAVLALIIQLSGLTDQLLLQLGSQITQRIQEILSNEQTCIKFPTNFNLCSKTHLLSSLIRYLSDFNVFRELMAKKTDSIQGLILRKNEHSEHIKSSECSLLERSMIIPKLKSQREERQVVLHSLYFSTASVKYLGADRYSSSYYFCKQEHNRIYVNQRKSWIDEPAFKILEGNDMFKTLLESLCQKGIKEKRLYQNLLRLKTLNLFQEQCKPQASPALCIPIDVHPISIQEITTLLYLADSSMSDYFVKMDYKMKQTAAHDNFFKVLKGVTNLSQLKVPALELSKTYDQAILPDGRKKKIRLWKASQEKTHQQWLSCLKNATSLNQVWAGVTVFKILVEIYVTTNHQKSKYSKKEADMEVEEDSEEHTEFEKNRQETVRILESDCKQGVDEAKSQEGECRRLSKKQIKLQPKRSNGRSRRSKETNRDSPLEQIARMSTRNQREKGRPNYFEEPECSEVALASGEEDQQVQYFSSKKQNARFSKVIATRSLRARRNRE